VKSRAKMGCEHVFGIPELADAVFLELSFHDVLVNVQRTCRAWFATVQSSTALQQAMFFKPIENGVLQYHKDTDTRWEPTRASVVGAYSWTTSTTSQDGDAPRIYVYENPLISRAAHDLTRPAAQLPTASWRRMLLTQPPVQKAELHPQSIPIMIGDRMQDRPGVIHNPNWPPDIGVSGLQ
jgi:hypothetical protein